MLMTRAVVTHLLPFFFLPHVHASTRACLIYEGEGVGATDRRVWHTRTFPRATDMRPTHSPKGRGRHNRLQSVAYEDLSRSNGRETHTLPYASGPVAMATSWSLGVRYLAMQNDEQTRVYKV